MLHFMTPERLQEIEDDFNALSHMYKHSHPQLDCGDISKAEGKVIEAVPGLLLELKMAIAANDILIERLEEKTTQDGFAG